MDYWLLVIGDFNNRCSFAKKLKNRLIIGYWLLDYWLLVASN